MGFMKRVFGSGGDGPGPAWAGSMTAVEADTLTAIVAEELRRRGLTIDMEAGRVVVARPTGEPAEYGLSNLAQVCKQVPRASWPSVVAEHFDNLLSAEQAQADLDASATDFNRVRPLLKVRLFPDSSLGGMDARAPVSWAPAPGLIAAFVFDLPTAVTSVKDVHIESWGLSHDELMQVALENVRSDTVESRAIVEGSASAPIACAAEHFFAASHAFLLDEMLPAAATHGAVFCVPHRHAMLYAPLVDVSVVQSINQLIRIGVTLFNQGPGSISPGLYWWRRGAISLLPASLQDNQVHFAPPDDFVQALNTLPEPS